MGQRAAGCAVVQAEDVKPWLRKREREGDIQITCSECSHTPSRKVWAKGNLSENVVTGESLPLNVSQRFSTFEVASF